MRYPRLYQQLYCEPLMLSAEAFAAFDQVFQSAIASPAIRPVDRAATDAPSGEYLDYYRRGRATMEQIRVEEVLRKYGPVAVVQVHGAIDRNLSRMEVECYGACDLQDINSAIAECEADDSLETVIFDFDTPGGGVIGLAETSAGILRLGQHKNTVAWVGGQCCSAGVYLAVHCHQIIIAEGAMMGSVGVRCARLDMTAAMEKQGVSVSLIASNEEKTDFSPAKAMTPEERARIQARVDMLAADFKARVRAGRPGISDDVLHAQIYFGAEAVTAGFADAVVPSLDDLAMELMAASSTVAANPGSAGVEYTARPLARADHENSFKVTSTMPFLAGSDNGGGNPSHDQSGRFVGGDSIRTLHKIDDSLDRPQREIVARVHDAIDKVHRVGKNEGLSQAIIRSDPGLRGARAAYMKGLLTGNIHMKPGVTNEANLVEEIGHHLDHQIGGRDFASHAHPDLAEVRDAIEKSSAVKELNRLARTSSKTGSVGAVIREWARPHEKFARAYTQYIAVKSGDSKIKAQVEGERDKAFFGKQKYWSNEDFSPIMKAVDNHLKKRRWT